MSNKILIYDEKDPQWMTEYIKSKIQCYIRIVQEIMRRLCLLTFYIISEVPELVVDVKSSYYDKLANKLTEPSNSSKIYWSILKAFCSVIIRKYPWNHHYI